MHKFNSIEDLLDCADKVSAGNKILFPHVPVSELKMATVEYLLKNSIIMNTEKYKIGPESVEQVRRWIKDRGGVAHWKSVNLSNPGGSWSTPATIKRKDCNGAPEGDPEDVLPYPAPNWQCATKPSHITTSEDDVLVQVPKLWRRFHVAVRRGSNGMSMKLTSASSDKVRAQVEKCSLETGLEAWHEFDYLNQDCCIFYPLETVPLSQYRKNS